MSKALKKGVVKRVLSGDTFVVLGPLGENGYPMEKRLSLYGIAAPWKGNETTPEDPFCFDSKEYLREKLANKEVEFWSFKPEQKQGEKPSEMVLAHVYLNGQDVSLDLVSKGHVFLSKKRTESDASRHPRDFAKYKPAFDAARESGLGIHGNPPVKDILVVKTKAQLAKELAGQTLKGHVADITYEIRFELFLNRTQSTIIAELNGVYIPTFGGDYIKKLRIFLYKRIFHRSVNFVIKSLESKDVFVVDEKLDENSVTAIMLTSGYAKLAEGAEKTLTTEQFAKYQEWEAEGKTSGKGIWGSNPSSTGAKAAGKGYRIQEVHSGDSVTIVDSDGKAMRVFLSNVRAPTMGNPSKDVSGQPFSFEAKEHTRRFVGQPCSVSLDFIKKTPKKDEQERIIDEISRQCATIIVEGVNIGVDLVSKGLAKFMTPKDEKERGPNLLELKEAEDKATSAKLGVHSDKKPQERRYWDLSVPGNKKKAKADFSSLFEKGQQYTAVVEHVMGPHRYKLRVDQTKLYIVFNANALRSLHADPNLPATGALVEKQLNIVKSELMQRNVKVEIDNVDKPGNFHGWVYLNGENYSHSLLERGLCYIATGGRPVKNLEEYEVSQNKAKLDKKGCWEFETLIQASLGDEDEDGAKAGKSEPPFKCVLSEVIGCDDFYAQRADGKIDEIHDIIEKNYSLLKDLKEPVAINTLCLAKFDDGLYRGKVTGKSGPKYKISFIDFGNSDVVDIKDMKMLPQALVSFKPEAIKCSLAYVQPADANEELAEEACEYFKSKAWEKKVTAEIKYVDRGIHYVLINPAGKHMDRESINFLLLKKGLVRIDPDIDLPANADEYWREAEAEGAEKNPEIVTAFKEKEYGAAF